MKNKMWQRLTSLLLVVCMVFGMSVNAFAIQFCGCDTPTGCDIVNCTACEKRVLGQHPDRNGDRHCDYCGFGLNHKCEIYYDADGHWGCQSENNKVPHIYGRLDDPNQCPCGYVKDGDVKLPEPTVETYKITVNPSENGSVTAPAKATAGETVTLTVSPAEGFELDTLTLSVKDASGAPVEVEVTDNSFPMPASDVIVTAKFKEVKQEPVSYEVQFKGGTEGQLSGSKYSIHVIKGVTDDTELTIGDYGMINVVRPDHKVVAWGNNGTVAVGETVTGKDLQAIDAKPYNGAVLLTAVWGPKDYTLHLQGGDYATLPTGKHVAYKTYSATEEVEFTNFDFTREGYTLTSWNNNHHYYNVGDTVSMKQINDDSWKPYEDEKVVLSAIWEANNYKVKFDGNGATSGEMADMDFIYDEAQTLTKNAYERVEGKNQFKFLGWSTSKDGEVVYTDGESVSNLTTEANGVVTLYAQWEQISTGSTPIGDVTAARYVVEYYKQDSNGQYVKDEAETFMSDAVAIGTEVTAEQKEFDGYKLNEGKSELSGIVSFNSQAEVPFLTLKVYYDALTSFEVSVEWDDDNDRDGKRNDISIPVRLYTGEEAVLNAENGWTASFEDVLAWYEAGNRANTVLLKNERELEETTGYTAGMNRKNSPSIVVTMQHIPEEVSFSGSIEWIDDNNRDGIRPENYVTVKLYKVTTDSYGREWETNVHTVTTGKNSNTEYSFASDNNVTLYKYENGEEIKYVAKVVSVDGYTSEFSDPEKVSATHVPETIDISGTITWDDLNNNDGFRPDAVTVTLKDGDETVNEKGAVSSYNFEKVYKYKNQGQEIEYTVVFEDVEKYEKEQDGYNVTYRHTIERAGTTVTVVWDDDNNRDGVRPEADSIGVELLGKPLESLLPRLLRTILGDEPVVYAESTFSESDANTWVYEFTNANKFFEGKEVIFQTQPTEETLNLLEAKGYNVDINNDTNTITLSRTPDVYSKVKAEIVWDDDDNRDGIRPENVVIRMFGSNGYSNTYNEKDGNWRHNFSSTAEKPIYVNEPVKNGVVYNVEVRDAVEGYISTVSGDVDSGFVITMTHMPELIDISGTITWKDGSDYDNIRPDSVVIKLIGDDKEYEETFNSMAGNVWEYELAGVHKYLNGKEIEYSVSQNKVPGYTTTIKNFDITNIHSPNYPEIEDEPEEKVVVKVKWFNDDSSYRPEEVTVQLYKDGRKYRAAAELSADKDTYENWRYVWEDVNEDEDTEWSIKVNGIPSEYIYEIEQVRSSYFVVNCTLNENEVKKNPETGAF